MENPASRFDLAYLYADGSKENVGFLALNARQVGARAAMVHVGDIKFLREALQHERDKYPHNVRAEVVIDFPDGAGGEDTKLSQARTAALYKADSADVVINLRQVHDKDKSKIMRELRAVVAYLPESKAIVQLPYLWHYHTAVKDLIPWVLDILVEAEIKCVKDWTTRLDNFSNSKEIDLSDDARLKYLEFISNYIVQRNLPLLKKIAGRVTPENAKRFLDAGADILGISYLKAQDVKKALENSR